MYLLLCFPARILLEQPYCWGLFGSPPVVPGMAPMDRVICPIAYTILEKNQGNTQLSEVKTLTIFSSLDELT